MIFDDYRYIYPPRAESKIQPLITILNAYDTGEFIAQPKYNGSCCNLFMNGSMCIMMNRHNEGKSKIPNIDFLSAYSGAGWMVLSGELMEKSKKGEDGAILNGFIIWDILVYSGDYLVGSNFYERLNLLQHLYGNSRQMSVDESGRLIGSKHLYTTNTPGLYRAPSYPGGNHYFSELYQEVINTDAYEGLVLKKYNGVLEPGFQEKNNIGWQLKVRKPNKNYKW